MTNNTYPVGTDIVVNFSTFSTIWQFTPISTAAEEFLENDCGFEDWQKSCGTSAVDHRPARDLARYMVGEGFVVMHPEYGYFGG